MRHVVVTGASGFIGKNICANLSLIPDVEVLPFTKDMDDKALKDLISRCDFVFHLAGINRPDDENEFKTGNVGLTKKILDFIDECGKQIPLLMTSSTQATMNNPYGKSKKAAEEIVSEWAAKTNERAYIYRLPNVFGKWCRPNYNSVVATFCNNIARGLDITISDPSHMLTLVYIDDVVSEFIKAMRGELTESSDGFYDIPVTHQVALGDLAAKLKFMKNSRESLVVPDFGESFERALYATYTSYLDANDFAYSLDKKSDDRGWLAEFIKSPNFGQIFISRTGPGISRGNHWHNTKIEKFLVIDGQAKIQFRDQHSQEILTYEVSGNELRVVDIPAGYVHAITNTGKTDLLTLFWADEMLNPDTPDTYFEQVVKQ